MKHWDDCTAAQKVERWEQVIRVLRGLTKHQRTKHWDMSVYLEKNDCGTIGCAAGHCALDPWFRRRGYRADWRYSYGDIGYFMPDDVGGEHFFGSGWDEIFENRTARPVGAVIREITAHIKEIRSERAAV